MLTRRKILILVEWFTPGYKAGGPIQSCRNICIALRDHYEISVLTTDTDHGELIPYDSVDPGKWIHDPKLGIKIFYAKKSQLNFGEIAALIRKEKADFVYLNLLFSPHFALFPLWLKLLGKVSAKVILCPRGTLYSSAISLKWYKKKPILKLLKWMGIHRRVTFHATNHREEKAIQNFFPGSKIVIADNLPDLLQPAFVTRSKETGNLNAIFIARIVPIKNLLYLLRQLAHVRAVITLTIVGPVENEQYWKSCKEAISGLPQHVSVRFEGPVAKDTLVELVQANHLFVLPTSGENFGHAIFEALLYGRPVLISDQTPWLDVYEKSVGWALPLHNPVAFAQCLDEAGEWSQEQFDQYAHNAWKYASDFIHQPRLTASYLSLFS